MEERSLELPAVIIGDRGTQADQPRVRVLPGRVAPSVVLFPIYAAVGLAALLATNFAVETGEWHPVMTLLGWGLLYSWFWVYGVGYRYRRWMMKYFALLMATGTAAVLVMVTASRAASMLVPGSSGLVVRSAQPQLFVVIALTGATVVAAFVHVVYLGRGYRQKRLDAKKDEP